MPKDSTRTWIRLTDDLHEDPRVFRMGQMLAETADTYITRHQARDLLGDVTRCVTRNALRDITIAGLARVWRAACRHTSDGTFRHADLDYLDTLAQIPGFGQAMAAVGWAVHDPATATVTLPNFLEHNDPDKNGQRAKTTAERQAEYRARKAATKSPGSTPSITSDPPVTDPAENTPRDVTRHENPVTSDVTRHEKSNGVSSISSSLSQSKNSESGEGECRGETPPTDSLTAIEAAKTRINRLRKSWHRLPHWNAEEEHALSSALANLRVMQEEDWCILAYYLHWCHSSANTDSKEPVRVTSRRHTFVTELPAYLDRATAHWRQTGRPRLNADGTKATAKVVPFVQPPAADAQTGNSEPRTANQNAYLGLLAAQGAELPAHLRNGSIPAPTPAKVATKP